MKMCSITSHVLLYVILVFFSRSSCFIVTYNPVRTSKSVAPVSFIRHCRTSLYQDLNGRSNLDIASTDKGNNLKSMKSINFSQKTIIAAVSVAALAITAVVSGLRIDFDFATLLERSLLKIESLGSLGYIYFALVRWEIMMIIEPTILMSTSKGSNSILLIPKWIYFLSPRSMWRQRSSVYLLFHWPPRVGIYLDLFRVLLLSSSVPLSPPVSVFLLEELC